MIEVAKNLSVGTVEDCRQGGGGWAVVHACKHPCHVNAVGYRKSLPPSHPHYLVLERNADLYLNMIDPPVPLFMPPTFVAFLAFAKRHLDEGSKILIHCNQGESRAPSLALLLLAKVPRMISDESYEAARVEFMKLYPGYSPGMGIQIYFTKHWRELGAF